jgi:hypothetical protein
VRLDGRWRATFYVTGVAHSIVGGTAWEPTPWRAVQRAAWEGAMQSMIASLLRLVLWLLCVLTLAGCAGHGRVGALPTIPDAKQAAEIIVIRDHRLLGAALTVTIVLDGVPLYGIDAGEHVILRVPTGEHVVATSHSLAIDRSIMIDAQAGRRYYLRLQPAMGSGMVPTPGRGRARGRTAGQNDARRVEPGAREDRAVTSVRSAAVFLMFMLAVFGCTTHGRVGELPVLADSDQAAQIVVIREFRFIGGGANFTVVLDGVPAYGIAVDEHVVLRVAPGDHVVAVTRRGPFLNDDAVTVRAEPRRRYYYRLETSNWSNDISLIPVPAAAGEALVSKTRHVK